MTGADELAYLSATELAIAYRRRELSPVEVTDAVLDRIDALDPGLNAFVTVTAELARAQARAAEERFLRDDVDALPSLLGIPVSVKDLEETAGVRTTYGALAFADNVPDEDAPIWARLKAEGVTLIGKTATPEFGNGAATESEISGITRNPWDRERSAGGSSGGAAVAVAAGFGPIATGSDGGGSIRVPASYCSVVGLKPSAGRIPFNDRANAWEQVTTTGPLTRTVADAALVLSAAHGPDPYDPYSLLESGIDFAAVLDEGRVFKGAEHPGLKDPLEVHALDVSGVDLIVGDVTRVRQIAAIYGPVAVGARRQPYLLGLHLRVLVRRTGGLAQATGQGSGQPQGTLAHWS